MEKFYKLYDYAKQHCAIYKDTKNNNIPSIDHYTYNDSIYDIISDEFDSKLIKTLRRFTFINLEGFLQCFYWRSQDIGKSILQLYKIRNKLYGISKNDKCCCTHEYMPDGRQLHNNERFVLMSNCLSINSHISNMNELESCAKNIFDFSPSWALLPSFFLVKLYETLNKENKKINLKVIEYFGTRIEESLKKRIEEFFSCKIVYLFGIQYSVAAYQISDEILAINKESAFILKDPDNLDRLKITALNSFACPIINYLHSVQDDIVLLNEKELRIFPSNVKVDWDYELVKNTIHQILLKTNNKIFDSLAQVIIDDKLIYIKIKPKYFLWKDIALKEIKSEINKINIGKYRGKIFEVILEKFKDGKEGKN